MKNKITINSKEYEVPEINFGTMCELEDMGIDILNIQNKSFNFIRGLVTLTIGGNLQKATEEIDAHLNNGGSIDDFVALIEAVTNSDFFQKAAKQKK